MQSQNFQPADNLELTPNQQMFLASLYTMGLDCADHGVEPQCVVLHPDTWRTVFGDTIHLELISLEVRRSIFAPKQMVYVSNLEFLRRMYDI